jgi:hypothetical protein
MTASGRLRRFHYDLANGRNRRIFTVPARSGEGPLTERTASVQPVRRERVFMPHGGHSVPAIASFINSYCEMDLVPHAR